MSFSWRFALVALAACGGGKTEPAVVNVPAASASAPPPVASASASAPAPVASAPASAAPVVEDGPCAVEKCEGKPTPALEQALSLRARQSHRCYDTVLAKDPTLKGKVTFAVRILADGKSCRATVGSSSMAGGKGSSDSNVPECMVGFFRDQQFPAPKGGCIDVNIPVSLEPKP